MANVLLHTNIFINDYGEPSRMDHRPIHTETITESVRGETRVWERIYCDELGPTDDDYYLSIWRRRHE